MLHKNKFMERGTHISFKLFETNILEKETLNLPNKLCDYLGTAKSNDEYLCEECARHMQETLICKKKNEAILFVGISRIQTNRFGIHWTSRIREDFDLGFSYLKICGLRTQLFTNHEPTCEFRIPIGYRASL